VSGKVKDENDAFCTFHEVPKEKLLYEFLAAARQDEVEAKQDLRRWGEEIV